VTDYPRDFGSGLPADLAARADEIEHITNEVTLESVSSWTDYADLALKALLVIAAFAIHSRL
jgi:hypothetical protein